MKSIANRLNNNLVSCREIDAAAGRYDEKCNCVRFPDGSAGRLITFRPRKIVKPLKETYVKFIELKVAGSTRRSQSHNQVNRAQHLQNFVISASAIVSQNS